MDIEEAYVIDLRFCHETILRKKLVQGGSFLRRRNVVETDNPYRERVRWLVKSRWSGQATWWS